MCAIIMSISRFLMFFLVKNLTDKVILGLLFINALYPFLVEHDGITTDPFGQKVKFKFSSKAEIDIDNLSYEKDSPHECSYPRNSDEFLSMFP